MSGNSHGNAYAAPTNGADGKRSLIGLEMDELVAVMAEYDLPAFRARQVWHWLYQRGSTDFESMTTLAKSARATLAEHFTLDRPTVARAQKSEDGTQKWLLKMPDGQEVETVHIPESDRGALCVSSQVGCTLTCRFCHTGTQPLVRNLSAAEILHQVLYARDALEEWPSTAEDRQLTNIVLMGMGEPLYNYDEVAKAMRIAMHGEGVAISKRRITLSTSGVVPMIERCGRELGVNLAISLHATNDELRDRIMPINKKYPLADLLRACREYPAASNARRITFEYVMLKDVNDSLADAKQLVKSLSGIHAKVNLIPFNKWPGAEFDCSDDKTIQKFAQVLMDANYASPIRTPRGRDILAACGQLKSDSMRQRRRIDA
ncbi:23S rRNA (adenine(2503)-C(2))-methyltransferase RlmN [Roseiterribacter gracilis]|uniref:Dual-specificity RNA methyltransferase RlmN n=1 Tax=Roseiterribacter gracilis TaxID=2812848 RepID=A0A8S8XH89_9PROT|nr:dual-specificity RNA methyltransferase RlmN [Rhodospirillales bacterium TMPK1]